MYRGEQREEIRCTMPSMKVSIGILTKQCAHSRFDSSCRVLRAGA